MTIGKGIEGGDALQARWYNIALQVNAKLAIG